MTSKVMKKVDYIHVFFYYLFLQPHLWHMEIPRPGVKSKLQLQVHVIDTAMSTEPHLQPILQLAAMPVP